MSTSPAFCRCAAIGLALTLAFEFQAAGDEVRSKEDPGGPASETWAPARTVKVAGIVLKWIRADKEANYRRIEPMIRRAAAAGARIVCTTECFLDGYAIADKTIPLETFRTLGERIEDGPYLRRLRALAGELNIHLVAGMLEAAGDARYNTAVLIGPDGKLIGKYHKQKLGHELVRNTPGTSSPVFSTAYGRIGLMICADRTERSIVRRFCDGGADFLICPSGGMYGPARNDPIVQARSRENGVRIVFVHPAEFLVTGPNGAIEVRALLGDRLLIPADAEGGDTDRNCVFFFDLPLPAPLDVAAVLQRPIIEPGLPRSEVRRYAEARIPRLPAVASAEEWEGHAERIRRAMLERVVFRGEAARWRRAPRRVEWLDSIEGGPGYRIVKLRYEALPGLWVPALLYRPEKLAGKVPVVLNVNGHDGKGKAAPYKQLRCINQAKRGMLALNVEWLGMGQLRAANFAHYRMNQLDLGGTSGLAPFYLSMERALDVLLSLEHADPERVAVAGLSGGGWQTIYVSSLDTRVSLSNPVAGYGSFLQRIDHPADLGDSEQTPVDMATIADYTHLTALLAPRPALLTYNAKDECCFKAAHTLPPLLEAAGPIYGLYEREPALRSHVNDDPGTHNFERENREQLYRMLGDFFFPESEDFRVEEIPSEKELKSPEELRVELPPGNADFHSLALKLSKGLPRDPALPEDAGSARSWQERRRLALAGIVAARELDVAARTVASERFPDAAVTLWALELGKRWTVPAVEIAPRDPQGTIVLVADGGRKSAAGEAERALRDGKRLLAVDPFYLGESAIGQRDFLFAMLVAATGGRPLGIQASQLAAAARWIGNSRNEGRVTLRAVGPRSSLAALVAAALDENAVDGVALGGSFGSLREIIEKNMGANNAPELFCFGLLEEFDIHQLCALVAPRPVRFLDPSERARVELSGLAKFYALLGSGFDPLR